MEFATIQKTSLVDYPGNVCSTIFTIGCNFRCAFCHNSWLVLPDKFPTNNLGEEQILSILDSRKKIIKALCITGGEPTMHEGLYDFIKKVKEMGLKIKLDSNGTNPEMLKRLINEKLIDYVAMDIKTNLEKYSEVTKYPNMDKIKQSIELLMEGNVDYEFRTTIAPPNIMSLTDLKHICNNEIKGAKKYAIQKFVPVPEMIDPTLMNVKEYSKDDIQTFVNSIKDTFSIIEMRGFD